MFPKPCESPREVLPLDKKPRKAKGKKKAKLRPGATTSMNGARYAALVEKEFKGWAKKLWGKKTPKTVSLIQDHERCLWMDKSLDALREAGFQVDDEFPKYSPDLNHIETVWANLRKELLNCAPTEIERRGKFLARLRRVVSRMNAQGGFAGVCGDQKERAAAVVELKGARTKW